MATEIIKQIKELGHPVKESGHSLKESGRPIKEVSRPIWVSVSEAADLGGIQGKTVRRAIKSDPNLRYKIVKNRYQIELGSLLIFLHKNTKLKNKLLDFGLGQYVEKWKD